MTRDNLTPDGLFGADTIIGTGGLFTTLMLPIYRGWFDMRGGDPAQCAASIDAPEFLPTGSTVRAESGAAFPAHVAR